EQRLWMPLLKGAAAVVTQDSGFTHVANIVNPRVLTLSRQDRRPRYRQSAARWRRPDQSYAVFGRASLKNYDFSPEVFSWLDQVLQHRDGTCRDFLIKYLAAPAP